ncbi:MAG TPA: SDR family NAD(P)-dependent oxidoreductase [Chloroflexi bacterium]|nr:SDR family NAD(P)-dependent oxidoreductase [Chloroflexota bacterium]
MIAQSARHHGRRDRVSRILVTGGAGFIGSNLSHHLLCQGHDVVIYDNLNRPGAEKNLAWLRGNHDDRFSLIQADVRDYPSLQKAVVDCQVVYHLAGQVAVTWSVTDPREDFEINALGTLNVLEAVRACETPPILLFTSTNKVYGGMEEVEIVELDTRHAYASLPQGVSEAQPLDFHSPYGCSKGAADQYVRDYARIYGLRTVVFRMSCIYGPRQFGVEDQGWVAHFLIASVLGRPITIYGDGKQIRDVLFVDDLIAALERAVQEIEVTAGQVYNIGGGPKNTISVWTEFHELLSDLLGHDVPVSYADWRPGDQLVYVSDTTKAQRELGWKPRTSVQEGIERLFRWVIDNKKLFE